jgi:hypothetical protein
MIILLDNEKINVQVCFKQEYAIRMLLVKVSNSWRTYQLLQWNNNIEGLMHTKLKRTLKNSKIKLVYIWDHFQDLFRSLDERLLAKRL